MSDEPRPRAPGRGLGRGLSALFGDEAEAPKNLRTVATELLHPGRFQPRRNFDEAALQALADSVRAQGILQPILVRRSLDNPNNFEILAGERRWRAAQAAQLHEVPVIVRELGDREASEIALVENIQRQDLNAIEEARGYKRLIDEFGHTQEALASALGKSRSHIANTMRLLNLPEEVQGMIADGSLTAGHARALVNAPDALELAKEVVHYGMSVRQTELAAKARRAPDDGVGGARLTKKDANVVALEQELSQHLGVKVTLSADETGGTLSLRYRTLDQLDAILAKLRAGQPYV
jgi:ParB family transcriptional regulator, chromosome partitioning protein